MTKDQAYKDNFSVTMKGKTIQHKDEILILGNLMTDKLTWERHIEKILLPHSEIE